MCFLGEKRTGIPWLVAPLQGAARQCVPGWLCVFFLPLFRTHTRAGAESTGQGSIAYACYYVVTNMQWVGWTNLSTRLLARAASRRLATRGGRYAPQKVIRPPTVLSLFRPVVTSSAAAADFLSRPLVFAGFELANSKQTRAVKNSRSAE